MKKNLIIIVFILVLATANAFVIFANDDKEGIKEHVKNIQEKINQKENNIVAKINSSMKSIDITDKQVITYCMNKEYLTKKPKDRKEALNEIVNEKVEYLIACEAGYEISDNVVKEKIEEVKVAIKENQEQKIFIENYMEALGLNEEEYYKNVFDAYKISLTIGNYKNNYINKEISKKNSKLLNTQYSEEYNQALDNFMKTIREKKISEKEIKVEIINN